MAEVVIEGVTKVFSMQDKDSQFTVFESLNLHVKSGEFVSLLGPSGCGKSTLLNIIAGLEQATQGMVIVGEHTVKAPGPDRGVVFQEASLMPWKTVLDNVVFAMKNQAGSKKEKQEKAMEYIRMVQLTKFARSYPFELSGGMKQRVAIARALAMDPEVLLMDEPFGALDEQTRVLLHKSLMDIWLKTKKTIIFVTHNIREAISLSDRIALMGIRPGGIRTIYSVDIPRPRLPTSSEVRLLEADIMDLLGVEIEKLAEEDN